MSIRKESFSNLIAPGLKSLFCDKTGKGTKHCPEFLDKVTPRLRQCWVADSEKISLGASNNMKTVGMTLRELPNEMVTFE